jgi:ethanolamine utilization protein EutQ (cupin superfamily)
MWWLASTSIIAGRRRIFRGDQKAARTAGDFWLVPAGKTMTVTTDDKAAVLRILSLPAQ